ncbi:MAG TPA: hypothetical protein VL624_07995 [Caldimonas sp.]|jgi:hypothetical protein|nr:hypothetical protein [Caldimonas sp.]
MEPARFTVARRALRALVAAGALLLAAAPPALAQVGALYRCASNEYTNMITAEDAAARGCAKIAKAEWVASGSDASGRKYEYNDRRTVYRGDGIVETWLQVVPAAPEVIAGEDAAIVKTVSRQLIRCNRHTIASGATYTFDPRDNSVVRDSREQSPFFPPPGPVAETLMRNLCANAGGR